MSTRRQAASAELVQMTLRVTGRRTTLRMERALWDAVDDVCIGLGVGRHVLISRVDARRDEGLGLTSALRVFLVSYWRAAAENPEIAVAEAVEAALSLLRDGGDETVSTMDRIAPELTMGRVRMIAALCGTLYDLQKIGEAARRNWRGLAPWAEDRDAVAGRALVSLTHRDVGAEH